MLFSIFIFYLQKKDCPTCPLNSPRGLAHVLFQIANVYDRRGGAEAAAQAVHWFELLSSRAMHMHDPGVLARLGAVYFKEEDEAKALHYFSEVGFCCFVFRRFFARQFRKWGGKAERKGRARGGGAGDGTTRRARS